LDGKAMPAAEDLGDAATVAMPPIGLLSFRHSVKQYQQPLRCQTHRELASQW
jgi:hypothetical protein